jgi:hypothetical protein
MRGTTLHSSSTSSWRGALLSTGTSLHLHFSMLQTRYATLNQFFFLVYLSLLSEFLS